MAHGRLDIKIMLRMILSKQPSSNLKVSIVAYYF